MTNANDHDVELNVTARFDIDPSDTSTDDAQERADDYEAIRHVFKRSKEWELVRIEYVENPGLKARYEAARAQFAAQNKKTDDLLVFHGTLYENVDSILANGFKIGGIDGHEQRWDEVSLGHGVYTARHLPSAAVYSKKQCAPDGCAQVIGLLALPGASAEPPLGRRKKNAVAMEQADSFDNNEWLVLYRSVQTLPVYVIHLKQKTK